MEYPSQEPLIINSKKEQCAIYICSQIFLLIIIIIYYSFELKIISVGLREISILLNCNHENIVR